MEGSEELRTGLLQSEEQKPAKRVPFDFGIKRLKRDLRGAGLGKHQVSIAAKAYRKKVYDEVDKVKKKMEEENKDASKK